MTHATIGPCISRTPPTASERKSPSTVPACGKREEGRQHPFTDDAARTCEPQNGWHKEEGMHFIRQEQQRNRTAEAVEAARQQNAGAYFHVASAESANVNSFRE